MIDNRHSGGNCDGPRCASANFRLIRGHRSLDSIERVRWGNMATVDRSLVAGLPLFAGFSDQELDEILRETRSQRIARNRNVSEQGEEAHSFFVLLHGHVRASKTTPMGEQVLMTSSTRSSNRMGLRNLPSVNGG
jgi:hypothetical protein